MASKPLLAKITFLLLLLLLSTTAISSNAAFSTTLHLKTIRYKCLNIHQGASVARRHGGFNNIPSGFSHTVFNFLPKGRIVPPSGPSPRHNRILKCVGCVNSASSSGDEVPKKHPSENQG